MCVQCMLLIDYKCCVRKEKSLKIISFEFWMEAKLKYESYRLCFEIENMMTFIERIVSMYRQSKQP